MGSFFSSVTNGTILTVTLQKPAQHNVLNPDEMGELKDHFLEMSKVEGLLAVVLTGEGKSFCAGANLGELGDYNFSENPLENLTDAIENFPAPVICKLNGGVYGGGTDLALACDFRVGCASMKCFIPPAKIGIHYHPAGMARAVSRLGLGPAKRLFLALETMNGQELKNVGFLDYLVEESDLDQFVADLAQKMSELAPLSLRGMKATFNDIARQSYNDQAAREAQLKCLQSADFEEGRKAMDEKRPPRFKGK
ncbi:enoyl-CoA hydratase/isomerase family protein [Sneathiella glossodoripedis]|uniref:enoyl-CoA hydratase/isomerase family protein n=1 Tax=Sneathiella glossodoripedis TaxID=418853 RepID=UPI0011DC7F4F|nr:enoyl-CoA hydratase-related protein [Sneathiella glossodoripedis]